MDSYLSKPLRRDALEAAIDEQLYPVPEPEPKPSPAPSPAPPAAPPAPQRDPGHLASNLLEMLRVTSLEAIERVRVAIAQSQAEEAARAVHFLKGGCALLQDAELTARLQELNEHAKAGRIERVAAALPSIESLVNATIDRHAGKPLGFS
jgi:HPt (histidine-containing phosphotransfer) domain-containing protein